MKDCMMKWECFFKPFHSFEKTERGEKKFLFLFLLPQKYLRSENAALLRTLSVWLVAD